MRCSVTEKKPIVVVAGATGRAGRLLVDELLQRDFKVRAMIVPPFDSPKPEGFDKPGIEIIEGSLSSVGANDELMKGADFLISVIGSTKPFNGKEFELVDVKGNKNLALAAKAAGVKQMVVISSVGAGDSKKALKLMYRLMMAGVIKAKTKLEHVVKTTGLDYTIIRPGGYTEKDLSGEAAIGEGGYIGGMVNRKLIAKVCVDAIENPAMKNRTFEVVDKASLKEDRHQHIIDV